MCKGKREKEKEKKKKKQSTQDSKSREERISFQEEDKQVRCSHESGGFYTYACFLCLFLLHHTFTQTNRVL